MCLIGFRWLDHPRWQLALAGNRDEFHARPAQVASWWKDQPSVYGGRDLEAGGSWAAINRRGRVALVTNYRDPVIVRAPRSRGDLVAGFVGSEIPIDEYVQHLSRHADEWAGFNLLLFELAPEHGAPRACYLSNRAPQTSTHISAGTHGLSNHLLDTAWPKVTRLCSRVDAAIDGALDDWPEAAFFDALSDRTSVDDADLPTTGIDLLRERQLAPAFIRADGYGTRASTVLLVDCAGNVEFVERTWIENRDTPVGEKRMRFSLSTWPGSH